VQTETRISSGLPFGDRLRNAAHRLAAADMAPLRAAQLARVHASIMPLTQRLVTVSLLKQLLSWMRFETTPRSSRQAPEPCYRICRRVTPRGQILAFRYRAAIVVFGPNACVADIRPERQLSGVKLRRVSNSVCGTKIFLDPRMAPTRPRPWLDHGDRLAGCREVARVFSVSNRIPCRRHEILRPLV